MIEFSITTPVLTNFEAATFLRLTEDYEQPDDAIRALHRLVREGKLKPLRCGKSYKFAIAELERFILDETASFEPTKRGASDKQTDGDAD